MPQKNRTVKGVLGGFVGLVGLSAVAGVLVTATVTPAIAMTGLAGSQALTLFDNLPTYLEVDAPMEPTTIYATRDGKPVKLASFYDQNRVPVTYEQVSPTLYDAILSSEDKNFYEHGGVDLVGTTSAVVDNLRGTSSRGGSTISQQYVKNVQIQKCEKEASPSDEGYADQLQQCWLDATNAVGAQGIERKLQEMRYAIQIEKEYSKNDILLGYLNIANFGGTVYGIEAAARYYFDTTAAKLNISQSATLAGMVQNPNSLRIDKPKGSFTNSEGEVLNSKEDGYALTTDRRNYVIDRMLADGKITEDEHERARSGAITPKIVEPTQGCSAAGNNAYFCQYVKSIVETDEAFGSTIEERQETLRRGGLEIYTTLDFRVQRAGVQAMKDWAPSSYEGMSFGAAAVSVEASTGRVLSMVQNTKFTESESQAKKPGYSGLVYAADKAHGDANGFPVGSTYKLFTLVDWLEKGHSVNEVLNGTNRLFDKMTCDGDPVYFGNEIVGNFGNSRGETASVMRFTSTSLNSGYMAMAERLNLCDINRVADRMGVTLGSGGKVTDENVPFDVLGSKNIAPLAMAGAYATVANDGVYCTPKAIDKIIGQDGDELPLPKSECSQVLEPNIAATTAYALQGVMNGGTGGQSNTNDGIPLIGKTGTHNEDSTMMIESSTEVATAVWVGNTKGQDSLYSRTYNGYRLSDLRHRIAPMIQRAANAAYGGDAFPTPDQELLRRVLTNLPSVVGMSVDEATTTLENAGFRVAVGSAVDSSEAEGSIAEQSPGAGQVAGGTTVTISPSNGRGAEVPNVSGQDPGDAASALQGAGFNNVSQHSSCSGDDDAEVQSTRPRAGSTADTNDTVTLVCR
ncbi:MAG: transglycosylase domain-containing protein [Actinomycetota bacterium]